MLKISNYEGNSGMDESGQYTGPKVGLGKQLLIAVAPAFLTILFEKVAESVFHHIRERNAKQGNTGKMMDGSDGNYYYLEGDTVYPVKITGVPSPADKKKHMKQMQLMERSEEEGSCEGCLHHQLEDDEDEEELETIEQNEKQHQNGKRSSSKK